MGHIRRLVIGLAVVLITALLLTLSSCGGKQTEKETGPVLLGKTAGARLKNEVVSSSRNMSTVLVIDNSKSMSETDPGRLSIQGAQLFVSLASKLDTIGVISYSTGVQEIAPMTAIDSQETASDLINKIGSIGPPVGYTRTDLALQRAFQMLNGGSYSNGSVLLLSDGELDFESGNLETPKETATRVYIENQLAQQYRASNWRIFTISLSGAEAEAGSILRQQELMSSLASATAGTYVVAPTAADLHLAFVNVFEAMVHPPVVPVHAEGDSFNFKVDDSIDKFNLIVQAIGGQGLPLTLTDPKGAKFNVSAHGSLQWSGAGNGAATVISSVSPATGAWKLSAQGLSGQAIARVLVSSRYNISMASIPDLPGDVNTNQPVSLASGVTEYNQKTSRNRIVMVNGVTVKARTSGPGGQSEVPLSQKGSEYIGEFTVPKDAGGYQLITWSEGPVERERAVGFNALAAPPFNPPVISLARKDLVTSAPVRITIDVPDSRAVIKPDSALRLVKPLALALPLTKKGDSYQSILERTTLDGEYELQLDYSDPYGRIYRVAQLFSVAKVHVTPRKFDFGYLSSSGYAQSNLHVESDLASPLKVAVQIQQSDKARLEADGFSEAKLSLPRKKEASRGGADLPVRLSIDKTAMKQQKGKSLKGTAIVKMSYSDGTPARELRLRFGATDPTLFDKIFKQYWWLDLTILLLLVLGTYFSVKWFRGRRPAILRGSLNVDDYPGGVGFVSMLTFSSGATRKRVATIGSSPDCDLCLEGPGVSEVHIKLIAEGTRRHSVLFCEPVTGGMVKYADASGEEGYLESKHEVKKSVTLTFSGYTLTWSRV